MATEIKTLKIVEHVTGTYAYHLSETGENMKPALCGYSNVMRSGSLLRTWNMEPSHIRYKFCERCHRIAVLNGHDLPEAKPLTLTFTVGK